MPDYSKGKVYKLVSNVSDLIYIGSTINPLYKRKNIHIQDYKRYLNGKFNYVSSFEIIKLGVENLDIILLEQVKASNRDELNARERFYIESMTCVNKQITARTPQ